MKAAIYCRISTHEQASDSQEKQCREYCSRCGHDIYAIYKDDGVSGMKTSRPAFDQLLKDMRLFKFDCIMVTKLDRIGRSLQHILSLFDEFSRKGVHFVATTQNIDTSTPTGKLQLHLLGAFAEFERNIIRERTIEGMVGKIGIGKRGKDKNPRKKRGVVRKGYVLVEKDGGNNL
jgi:site-specific DNA recombinase